LATLDEPLTLPLFDVTNSVKRNVNSQNSTVQPSNSFYPPLFIMPFPFYYPNMFNQQASQPFYQQTYSSNNSTNLFVSVLSIDEFFGKLEKDFGKNNFEEVKNKFVQKSIDVSDILDLKESD
jgi:hypothetical protein